jgi:hypothetical protein
MSTPRMIRHDASVMLHGDDTIAIFRRGATIASAKQLEEL